MTSSCYLAIVVFCDRGSQGGKENLVDGKKPLAGSSWRPLWGGLECAGRSATVVTVVFEGCSQQHCEQQRKGSDSIQGSWGGKASANPAKVCLCDSYRAQLVTIVTPSLTLPGAVGAHVKDVMKKQPFVYWLSVSFMLPHMHGFEDPKAFVLRRPQMEGPLDRVWICVIFHCIISLFELCLL